ncbi:MAG: hypothetical protein LC624_09010, partial [Halobacteriales archaeon]|nr:hypothetical protein [Halobacteriales archaeon]
MRASSLPTVRNEEAWNVGTKLVLLVAFAGLAVAFLAMAQPAHAALPPPCDTFVVSNTSSEWRTPTSGVWNSPSTSRTRNGAWTVFPNGGPGTPTPLTIWADNQFVPSAYNFRNLFKSCGGTYVLDITADNRFVAWVNDTQSANGAQVQQCLDPNGFCFQGYFHANFTPACTNCQLEVGAYNMGSDAMIQYRLE